MIKSFNKKIINYYRFDTNMGLDNFLNVINMSESEYCWMIGSDDLITEYSIKKS